MIRMVKKYLIPNEGNEYKPHLLRNSGIAAIASLAIIVFSIGVFQNFLFQNTSFLSAVLPTVLADLANENRAENQLAPLTTSPLLEQIAQAKANDMAAGSYFAHTSPSGKQFYVWFREAGYNFAYAGENLAVNFSDSQAVDTAWMNSPEHRANLLNGKFTEIGIATANGFYDGQPTIFVVQEFGRPQPTKTISASSVVKITSPTPKATTTPGTTTPSSIATKQSSNVLGVSATQKEPAPRVIAENQTFVAVENTAPVSLVSDSSPAPAQTKTASVLTTLATEPDTLSKVYMVLAALVILAIALLIGVEIKHQHPRMVIAGLVLLVFIVALFYIYQNVLFGQVIII